MRTSRNSKRRRPEPETYRPSGTPVRRRAVPRYMQEKLAVTVLVIMLALFALSVVLYRIVDQNNDDYTRVVLSQHSTYDSRTIPYRRGDIVDRNGTYLATSERVYNLILAVVTAVVIVMAMNLVGSLLISALVIFPAMSAMRLFKSFRAVTICAAVLSVFCAAAGIITSILAGTPVGSTIVAVQIALFVLCSLAGWIGRR